MRACLVRAVLSWVLLIHQEAVSSPRGTHAQVQHLSALEFLLGPAPGTAPILSLVPFGSARSTVERSLPRFDRIAGLSTFTDASIIPSYRNKKLDQLWINCREGGKMLAALPRFSVAWGNPSGLSARLALCSSGSIVVRKSG